MTVLRLPHRQTKVAAYTISLASVCSDEIVQGTANPRACAHRGVVTTAGVPPGTLIPVGRPILRRAGAHPVSKVSRCREIRDGDTGSFRPTTAHGRRGAGKLFSHLAMSEQTEQGRGAPRSEHYRDADLQTPDQRR